MGNCTIDINQNNIANINPFRYRGYYYDSESGLYYLMSRYYDPEIGQFISMDTPDYLAPETIGGVDLYAYGLNNPIMFVDPTGHVALWLGVLIAIGVVGLAVGGITATSSAIQGSSIGQVFLDGFLGVAIGVTSAGIIGCLIGVGYVLVTGVTVIGSFGVTLASLGAAAMFLGGYILAVLQGKEPGDSEAFPQPGYVPPWPPTTTGS